MLIDFNYDVEPLPGKYPVPYVGPMTLLKETRANHLGKLAFRHIYWNVLLPGRPVPLPAHMSMAGKHRHHRSPPRRPDAMPTTTIDGHEIHVNDEGFLTDPDEWNEPLATSLAAQIGIELTDEHWKAIRFLREDFAEEGETADAAPRSASSAASRPRRCSSCSRRSRPRSSPTSRACPSRTAASEATREGESTMTTTETPTPQPRAVVRRARRPTASSPSSAPRATSTWPTRP